MKPNPNPRFRILYGTVVTAGIGVIAAGGYGLIHDHLPFSWLILSLLTVAAGSLSLKIPGVNGRASVGDALICLSVFLFGPLAGAVTAALEGVAGSFRCRTASRRLEFVFFNAGAMALSAYLAGLVFFAAHGRPLFAAADATKIPLLPLPLMAFAATYFFVNTGVVAAASALEKSVAVVQTWHRAFLWTGANYLAATFVAGTLVQFADPLTPPVLATLVAGCAGLYFTSRAHVRLGRRAAAAEASPEAPPVVMTADHAVA